MSQLLQLAWAWFAMLEPGLAFAVSFVCLFRLTHFDCLFGRFLF